MKKIAIIAGVLVVVLAGFVSSAWAGWYNTDWQYRQLITVSSSMTPNTDQSNFPVLIELTDALNAIFTNAQADGDDILFTLLDGTTKLSHEIEKFETTSGSEELIAWVKIPTLANTTDTFIYIYYGNVTIGSQQDATGVWDGNYKMVQHMTGAAYTDLDDSTENDNDVTTEGGDPAYDQTGKISNAVTFDGDGDYVNTAFNDELDSYTVEAWIKPNFSAGSYDGFMNQGGGYSGGWRMFVSNTSKYFRVQVNAIAGNDRNTGTNSLTDNTWHHAAFTFSYPGTFSLYLNGVSESSGSSKDPGDPSTSNVQIGLAQWYFTGTIDEVRISDTARSADWIKACSNNQSSPSTYLTFEAGHDNQLVITTAAKTFTAGTESDAYTVQLQDLDGVPQNVASDLTVNLSSNSTGTYHFAATQGGASVSSVTIGAGTNSTNFYYTDEMAGTPAITCSATGVDSFTQQQTVNAAAASKLVITTSAKTLIAGAESDAYTVEIRDTYDNTAIAGADITVNLSSDSTNYHFAASPGGASVPTVTILNGTSSTNFYYTDEMVGTPTITCSATDLTSATQQQIVNAQLDIITSAKTLTAGVESDAYTVQLQDGVGDPATTLSDFTVNLSSDSSGTHWFAASSGGSHVTSVTIPAGSSSVNFYYTDCYVGTPTITCSQTGYDSAMQQQTVNAPAAVSENTTWWNSSWRQRMKITFDNSSYPETHVHFPVLVKLTTGRITYSLCKAAGADIRFVDSDQSTELKYEIEKWDADDESFIWVKVPAINASSTTDHIWMYYGNSAASDNQDANNVWDSNYIMVQHLQEAPANGVAGHIDSTSNSKDGTPQGFAGTSGSTTDGTGKINGADEFDGDGDYVANNGGGFLPSGDNPRTITFWFKPNAGVSTLDIAFGYGCQGTECKGCSSAGIGKYVGAWATTSNIGLHLETCGNYGPSTPSPTDGWHFYTAIFNGDGTLTFYVDGGSKKEVTPSCTINTDNGNGYTIGAGKWGYYNGSIDEVRISNTARSADWIATCYLSQSDAMNTYGGETHYYSLAFSTSAKTLTAGTESDAFTLELQDPDGTAVNAPEDITINLSSSSTGTSYFRAAAGGVNVASVPLPSGSSSVNFYYIDYQVGSPTITVSSTGYTTATQQQTVQGKEGAASTQWWSTSWRYRKKITFDNSEQSSALTNFPVLVKLSLVNFTYSHAQSNGEDIRFMDADQVSQLPYEIEKWDATGNSFIWVRVPQIDASSATDHIWMYYGNSSASDVQNASSVWDGNYVGVWHLDEAYGTGADNYEDSTSNAHHGTLTDADADSAQGTGQIGNCMDFNGDADYIRIGRSTSLEPSNVTIELWANIDAVAGQDCIVTKTYNDDASGPYCSYATDYNRSSNDKLEMFLGWTDGSHNTYFSDAAVFPTTTWTHIAMTYDGSNVNIYINGTANNSPQSATKTIKYDTSSKGDLYFGAETTKTTYPFDGSIDEVRISSTARSADWISASYLSQTDALNSYGSEQTPKLAFTTSAQTFAAGSYSGKLRVQVQDSDNSPIDVPSDITINLTTTSSTGRFSDDGSTWSSGNTHSITITSGNNSAFFYYKDTVAGSHYITAAESPSYGWDHVTQDVTVVTGSFTVKVSSPQVAGNPFTVTVTALDNDDNTDTNYSGTVNLTVRYGELSVTSLSLSEGVATTDDEKETFSDCGTINIVATDATESDKTGRSSNIVFVPYDFTVVASSLDTSASGSAYARHIVSKPFTLTITARNASAVTCPNYTGTATLSVDYTSPSTSQSGSLGTSSLTSTYWSNGVAEITDMTYNKWGTITITCTDSTLTTQTGTSDNIIFIPKDFSITLSDPPASRTYYYTNEDFSATVAARDYNNTTISNYTGTISFTGSGLTLPSNYTFTTADAGSHTFSGINGSEETSTTLSVKDTTYTSVTGTSSTIFLKAGTIKVISTSGPVGKVSVTVKVLDSGGDILTEDDSTTFTVTLTEFMMDNDSCSSTATSTAATVTDGQATIVLEDTEPETVTVTPSSTPTLTAVSGTVRFGTVSGSGVGIQLWRELRGPGVGYEVEEE